MLKSNWLWITIFYFIFQSSQLFAAPIQWRQLDSVHFRLIYQSTQKPLAESYISAAEKAYSRLLAVFSESPSLPITILLTDHTDFANGSATFLPYALIVALPVLPEPGTSISDYENWAYELILHELVHLFNFAPAHGFYKPLTYLFGNVIRPNGILPRWFLEGQAVELETRLSRNGRLRSSSTAAKIRALTKDQRWDFESLDRINESSLPFWPYGERPYLFGSLMWHNHVESEGVEVFEKLNQRFSRRLPFLLNTPFRDLGGLDLNTRWGQLKQRLQTESLEQLNEIKKAGEVTQIPFPEKGELQFFPLLSPNGEHLLYLSAVQFKGASLKLISRPAQSQESFQNLSAKSLLDISGFTRAAWFPDSRSFIFDQADFLIKDNRRFTYRDLYRYSLDTSQSIERLTTNERASQPALSPSGSLVAFIRNQPGRHELVVMNLKSKQKKVVLSPRLGTSLSFPLFWDESTIIFVGQNAQGDDRLYQLNLKTLKRLALPEFSTRIRSLQKIRTELLVAAEIGGLTNLYSLHPTGQELKAITNTSTEIADGTWDATRQEVLYTELTGLGPRLRSQTIGVQSPPKLKILPTLSFKDPAAQNPQALMIEKVSTYDQEYSAWPYLVPRYWIPFIYPVENGILFQGLNETSDPTGRHLYTVSGSYDSITQQGSYGLKYVNSYFPVHLGFLASESNELLGAKNLKLTNRALGIDASAYLPSLSNAWSIGGAANQIQSDIPSSLGTREVQRLGLSGQLIYDSSAAHLQKSNFGDQFYSLSHTHFLEGDSRLSYDRSALQLAWTLREYFPARHHLSFQMRGSHAPALGLPEVVALGDRTIGGNYLVSLVNSNNLLRGYPSGALVGRTLITTNLDYRFPLADLYFGNGSFPLFLRNLDLAFFVDNAMVDGAYYSPSREGYFRDNLHDVFTGSGLEFVLNATAAYHLPLYMTMGLYYGFDTRPGGGFLPFISLGYVGHTGVDAGAESSSTRLRPASLAR